MDASISGSDNGCHSPRPIVPARLLVEDAITQDPTLPLMLELGSKCGSNKKRRVRGRIRPGCNLCVNGSISTYIVDILDINHIGRDGVSVG